MSFAWGGQPASTSEQAAADRHVACVPSSRLLSNCRVRAIVSAGSARLAMIWCFKPRLEKAVNHVPPPLHPHPHVWYVQSDDPYLVCWRKLPDPVIRHPPPGLPLSCWRDPFCLERGDPAAGKEWTLLLASGLRGRGGAVLVFKSPRLLSGGGSGRRRFPQGACTVLLYGVVGLVQC